MAGLLDALNSRDGIFALGLLDAAAPRPVRTSLGGGLLQALGRAQAWQQNADDRATAAEERKQRAAMQALQQQLMQAQIAQGQAQAAEQARARAQADADAKALRRQFGELPGPTPDGAALMPRMDVGGMLGQGASLQAVQQAMALQQAMQKPTQPNVKLSPGEQMFSPDGKPLFGVPAAPDKPPAPSDLARLLAEMQQLPPGSPARKLYEQQIAKITTHAPPQTQISLGSPVPVVLPDGSHGLVQPSNRPGTAPQLLRDPVTGQPMKAASTEKLKPVPPNINTAISENRAALGKIDAAISAIQANPAALGAKNYIPDPLIQRADPSGVDVRARVADIGSLKIHDRSGAAVSAAEFPRLRPFIPAATDTPQVAATKLRQLRAEYQTMLEDARLTYSRENGYMPPPVFTAPTRDNAGAMPSGFRVLGKEE